MQTISKGPVILFDGVCNLCDASVRFIIRRDKKKQFRFASLQSDVAKKLLLHHYDKNNDLNSIVLIGEDKFLFKSDAIVEIFSRFGFPWRALSWIRFLPKSLRDKTYDWVARNRYKWFGQNEHCKWMQINENRFIH